MGIKKNNSPLNQSIMSNAINAARGSMNQANPTYAQGMVANATQNIVPGMGAMSAASNAAQGVVSQMTPRPQTPISPKAMSNQGNINAMFGQAIPGTFNRNVNGSPFMQMTSQGYIPPVDPTNDTMGPDVNALITGNTGQPIMPPTGVQQEITPTYDLSNQ